MLTVFLGAGFSRVAGVPLAQSLFDREPNVDKVTRRQLVRRVLENWKSWQKNNSGIPEEYLAVLQDSSGKDWIDAVWYVSLVIALKMGRVEYVGMNPTITRHNINRTSNELIHEKFWTSIFRKTTDVAVLTTNYDILAERGIRHQPRPRVTRPGFHYGYGTEELNGGGYPSYSHIQKITVSGTIPLLKLHGSISWSQKNGKIIRYHDCRPAIRGDAAIVAPVTEKRLPDYLNDTWMLAKDVLLKSNKWIFVGYSLPEYDKRISELLQQCSKHKPNVHVFDPNPEVAFRYRKLLTLDVNSHPGLPEGLNYLEEIL